MSSSKQYVFIVGLPRTGTKLVKHVLESARSVLCRISPESFYVGQLFRAGMRRRIMAVGDLADDRNVERAVELMFSGRLHGYYWQRLIDGSLGVDRSAMKNALLASDRSEAGIYRALLEVHVDDSGGGHLVLGDKTPSHIYHVPQILEWFPEARIVHTFRDIRAVLASEWKRRMSNRSETSGARLTRPFASLAIVVHMTYAWLKTIRLHRIYQEKYPENYLLCRFEDLVTRPDVYTPRLCQFLGIEFCEEMLRPRQVGSSFAEKQIEGFDRRTLLRWKSELKPWMLRWLEVAAGKELKSFGYTDADYEALLEPVVSGSTEL